MKKTWIAAVVDFFLMGPGTPYNGRRKALGIALTLSALALTYVERSLQETAPGLYPIMFGAAFLMNRFFDYDGYTEAKAINAGVMGHYSIRGSGRPNRENSAALTKVVTSTSLAASTVNT